MVTLCLFFMVQAQAFLPFQQKNSTVSSVVDNKAVPHRQEIIVLIHGLMRTYMSMSALKSYLESQGYQVYYYSYPSSKYTIHQHAIRLHHYVEQLMAENPGATIHFITHSLGGIIIREALAKLGQKEIKRIGCLIMLAPPNQGSVLAKLSTRMFPFITSSIKPLAELSSDQSAYVHHVPVPNIKIGIIAGRFDAKVPPTSAELAGQKELRVVNSTHTFIMNSAATRKLIINFLHKGSFEE